MNIHLICNAHLDPVWLGPFEALTLCYHLQIGKWTQVNLMEEFV